MEKTLTKTKLLIVLISALVLTVFAVWAIDSEFVLASYKTPFIVLIIGTVIMLAGMMYLFDRVHFKPPSNEEIAAMEKHKPLPQFIGLSIFLGIGVILWFTVIGIDVGTFGAICFVLLILAAIVFTISAVVRHFRKL